jgi:serine/threonine-protein kinase
MGVVYKAEDEENKRPVAVKVIGPSIAKDPQAEALFRREAQMALSVRHPNVVETYEFGMAEDALYFIAMEFVPGQKLRDVIDREVPFDLNRTINITQQIAEGLEVAHSQGIIHRDLKPENIMLCQTPEKTDFVKVLDFGLAKKPEYDLTQPGTIRGTLRYMSPEHILEEPVDARADVYSLGLIVYEMLSGRFPFVKWADKLKEDPILLTRIRDDLDLPSGVEAAVMRALAKNRELRTSSALEFARELEQGALGQSSVA